MIINFCCKGVGRLMQIRDTYSMVVSAKADYLKEHPELDKESTGGAEVPKQLPSDADGRSLTRKLSRSQASFKWELSSSAISRLPSSGASLAHRSCFKAWQEAAQIQLHVMRQASRLSAPT